MTKKQNMPKLHFPKITRAILQDFSLFTSMSEIDVSMNDGVFCLAGANGLGKSTFLAAVNYAFTGIVSDPDRSFDSIDEYYKHSRNYASEFFTGRIAEEHRESSQISLEFQIDKYKYEITRGLFEPESLRKLIITDLSTKDRKNIVATSKLSPEELHEVYAKQITGAIGLATFPQFVFLQHFVFTFDERRHLLFWDQKVLEDVLFLCFGLDYQEANRAASLRRDAEKAGSLARNYNWQASEVRKKINSLIAEMKGSEKKNEANLLSLVHEHKALQDTHDQLIKAIQLRKNNIQDNMLRISDFSAQQLALRTGYEEAFDKHLQSKFHVSQHPVIAESIKNNRCVICGANSIKISKIIDSHLREARCPLCAEALTSRDANKSTLDNLKKIDKDLTAITKKIGSLLETNKRNQAEIYKLQSQFEDARSALLAFEQKNEQALEVYGAQSSSGSITSILQSYQSQLDVFLKKKQQNYQKRDEKLNELSTLQRQLEHQYEEAEAQFVPLFKSLAVLFLGLDLDVRLAPQSSSALNLVVDVNGTTRRQHHQLSESQRFFIDIALRMALAQFISAPSAKAALFIDTPEGSLDIAYESRAGLMLAKFVKSGHAVIMTANINSSKLLLSLAKECTISKMQLLRMTNWTELSKVQIEEEDQFETAYKVIESTLKGRVGRG